VWLGPLEVKDPDEMEALLLLSCSNPEYKDVPKALPTKIQFKYASQFERMMWQWVVKAIGGEYRNVSLFPYPDKNYKKFLEGYLEYMYDFRQDFVYSSSPTTFAETGELSKTEEEKEEEDEGEEEDEEEEQDERAEGRQDKPETMKASSLTKKPRRRPGVSSMPRNPKDRKKFRKIRKQGKDKEKDKESDPTTS